MAAGRTFTDDELKMMIPTLGVNPRVVIGQAEPFMRRDCIGYAYRADEFCTYLRQHVPDSLEFVLRGNRYTFDDLSIGVLLEATPEWIEKRGLACTGRQIDIPRTALSSGILNDLTEAQAQGLVFEQEVDYSRRIITYHWSGNDEGDGFVLPNKVGGLIVRWLRPVYLQTFHHWLKRLLNKRSGGRV